MMVSLRKRKATGRNGVPQKGTCEEDFDSADDLSPDDLSQDDVSSDNDSLDDDSLNDDSSENDPIGELLRKLRGTKRRKVSPCQLDASTKQIKQAEPVQRSTHLVKKRSCTPGSSSAPGSSCTGPSDGDACTIPADMKRRRTASPQHKDADTMPSKPAEPAQPGVPSQERYPVTSHDWVRFMAPEIEQALAALAGRTLLMWTSCSGIGAVTACLKEPAAFHNNSLCHHELDNAPASTDITPVILK